MPTEKPEIIATRIYELGGLYAELRARAEWAWCDSGEDQLGNVTALTDLGPLRRAVAILQANALEVAPQLPNTTGASLRQWVQSLESFWKQFRNEWESNERVDQILGTANADSEFVLDRDKTLLKGVMLNVDKSDGIAPSVYPKWIAVRDGADAFAASLTPEFKACFKLGHLLTSEIYPTISGGQRLRNSEDNLVFYATKLSGQVEGLTKCMIDNFPSLGSLRIDLKTGTNDTILDEICNFQKMVGERLRHPQPVLGYLGLFLDPLLGRVSRNGNHSELKADQRRSWTVVKHLVQGREHGCTRDEIDELLNRDGPRIQSDFVQRDKKVSKAVGNSIDKAISDLRPVLRPLGIQIEAMRRIGFRLVEISALPGTKRTVSRRMRGTPKASRQSRSAS
jgi:hypothetical protein